LQQTWPDAPDLYLIETIFATRQSVASKPVLGPSDPVTIIYTSGTSGEAKGVVLTAGNVEHMVDCTSGRLDILMRGKSKHDRVFHYLPFCFCGSWILLLTCCGDAAI